MSRRLMLRNAAAEEDVPIGVNLVKSVTDGGFYSSQLAEANVGNYYTTAIYSWSSQSTSDPMPFNSDYEYSFSGQASGGNSSAVYLDEDYLIMGHTPRSYGNATLISTAKSIESRLGKKIKYIAVTFYANQTKTWMRTA